MPVWKSNPGVNPDSAPGVSSLCKIMDSPVHSLGAARSPRPMSLKEEQRCLAQLILRPRFMSPYTPPSRVQPLSLYLFFICVEFRAVSQPAVSFTENFVRFSRKCRLLCLSSRPVSRIVSFLRIFFFSPVAYRPVTAHARCNLVANTFVNKVINRVIFLKQVNYPFFIALIHRLVPVCFFSAFKA